MEEDVLLKKLRWRCRRGMRELDQLFGRYLDREWSSAPTEEREVFLFLLDCEDDKSSPSSLEWRPSRLQAGAQLAVLLAAPWLLRVSDLPSAHLVPALIGVWVLGLGELTWRLRRPPVMLQLPPLPEPLRVDGQDISEPRLVVRGPWLLLHWREGWHRRRLLFWPDVLDRGQRRELRLAVSARGVSRQPRSVAP
uniref:Uncharacterized protein n=1 Tax=Knufia peltigerae TaxID=1002370 RepID=A0AA38XK30_9EURO|nr:hypothetical protein H2204_014390 [Knufia peltigerae]